jgi:selenocysteine-specific elongation factor
MQVIATAGHVDHGKSTLVRALTGIDPDRWEEEQRRGLTIDLGYAWLTLPSGEQVAFVDVPGHERFVPNMLAGVGPVPAVMFVVAADEGWMPQSGEHLAVIDALGIRHGLLVITRADLADPGPARAQAAAAISRSSLGAVDAVEVSAVTGAGLPRLIAALDKLAADLPAPDPGAPVRLWIDRAFSITGSGTVVTGTLPAGVIHRGEELVISPAMRPVRVRSIQTLGESVPAVTGVARTALNLRGVSRDAVTRGMALVTAGRWTMTDVIDVRIPAATSGHDDAAATLAASGEQAARLPRTTTLHLGSARTIARIRPLGGQHARLSLRDPLPLHVGDRFLLRDPGAARARQAGGGKVPPAAAGRGPADDGPPAGLSPAERTGWPTVLGGIVLDVTPPPLLRRGAAAAAARELASWPDQPAAAQLLGRHGLVRASAMLAMGIREHPAPVTGEWLADPGHWTRLAATLGEAAAAYAAREPLAAGMPVEAARAALQLPDRRLVEALIRPPFRLQDGMIQLAPPGGAAAPLPEAIEAAVRVLRTDLAAAAFLAPDADRLRRLGLDVRAIAAAERAGLLLRISDQIVLAPGADAQAAAILATLPQPFTAAQARQALNTTRRIAIPLLEHLDRQGITERMPDDRRQLKKT